MHHIRNLQERTALRAKIASSRPDPWLFGDVISYDPTTMRVRVRVQNNYDPNGVLIPTETIWMPLVSPFLGPNYGQQISPPAGAQVLVLRSADGDQWVALGFTANVNAQPPYPAIQTGESRLLGKNGAYAQVTNDGPTPGDALGGLTAGGGALVKHVTRNGHSDVFNDTAKTITRQSAGGHTDIFSDAVGAVHMTRTTAGGAAHVMDDVTAEISSVATNVTLGARLASMTSANAALNNSHLTSYESNRLGANLQDVIKNANLYHAAETVSAGQLTIILAALVSGWTNGATVPAGSSIVKLTS